MHPSSALARSIAIIPARYGSTRFPGKPLVDLDGKPMVVRVADRVRAAKMIDFVAVATDDERIRKVVFEAGHVPVMTPSDCASGTDRVHAAYRELKKQVGSNADILINVQGDEPLIDPDDIDVLVNETRRSQQPMGTLARPLTSREGFASETIVKVVTRLDGVALYFSRAPIPRGADPESNDAAALPLQHVGIYAYRPDALERLASMPRTALEIKESLEQLRALENGIAIHVAMCVSPHPTAAIDVPEDVDRVLTLLRQRQQRGKEEVHAWHRNAKSSSS